MAIYVWPESIRCSTGTSEVGSDEPYFLVAVANLNHEPLPESKVHLYGPFGGMSAQITRGMDFHPSWGLNGEERFLVDAERVVFIVGLLENDDGHPEALRGIAAAQVSAAVAATLGSDRATIVTRLLETMNSAMQTPTGFPNLDDVIGGAQELRFNQNDINLAENGITPVRKALHFTGDGGHYILNFAAQNRGQSLWRFCSRCSTLFFSGFSAQGACPAGGAHTGASTMYFIPHDHPLAPSSEGGWRFCDRCFALVFTGFPNPGVCPAGGAHNATGFSYFLTHDIPGPGPGPGAGQPTWRFCTKCQVLFFDGDVPNPSVCAAGAGHQKGRFNYRLDLGP